MDTVRTLEGEVRELIRRSGLDPVRDEPAVRRLVQDAVSDYDERSMHGGLPVLADLDATSKALWDSVIGYGPLQQYFDDPVVEEIRVKDRLTAGSCPQDSGRTASTKPSCPGRGAHRYAVEVALSWSASPRLGRDERRPRRTGLLPAQRTST